MKRIFLLGLGAYLAFGLASCDGISEPWPNSQLNYPESALQTSEVSVADILGEQPYDLEAMAENGLMIEVATISCDNLPEGFSFGAIADISADDFQKSVPVNVEITPADSADMWTLTVHPDSIQQAFYNGIEKTGDTTPIQIRFLLTTVQGTQTAIIGGKTHYYGPYGLTITPYPISAPQYLYTPGDANGWNPAGSMKLWTNDFVSYIGYAVLGEGGFKFTSQPDWDGINYGAGEEEGTLSTDGGAGNLAVGTTGLYWCAVNPSELTYTVAPIETIGIIGDATEGAWDNSTPLSTTDYITWTGDVYLYDGTFKFRANNAWDYNLGGSTTHLVPDGDNIPSPGEGEYTVTLNLGQLPYTCTLTAK